MYELSAATLLLSLLLTWSIGLLPPVLIRFLFLRRPIGKWPAIGICTFFWFFNVILFSALGSESKTHAALILVALASYWILRRERKSVAAPEQNLSTKHPYLKGYLNTLKPWQQRLWRLWLVVLLPGSIYLGYEAYDAHKWIGKWNENGRFYREEISRREEGMSITTLSSLVQESGIYSLAAEDRRDQYLFWSLLILFSPLYGIILYKICFWIWGDKKQGDVRQEE